MPRHPTLVAALIALLPLAPAAFAGGKAGDFDFYVLALTWTPGYCATADNPDRDQCADAAGFSVHGLWPEYEVGYPDYCPSSLPRSLSQSTLDAIAGIMPSESLARYEWRKHGLCSGLSESDYFNTVKRAAAKVKIPKALTPPAGSRRLSPDAVEALFSAANPGLGADAMAVQCARGQLTEVRICLTTDLAFRRCLDVDDGGCRAASLALAP